MEDNQEKPELAEEAVQEPTAPAEEAAPEVTAPEVPAPEVTAPEVTAPAEEAVEESAADNAAEPAEPLAEEAPAEEAAAPESEAPEAEANEPTEADESSSQKPATDEAPSEEPAAEKPEEIPPPNYSDEELHAILEALVYVTEEPLEPKQLAQTLRIKVDKVQRMFAQLVEEYSAENRGIQVREIAGGFKMFTKPQWHEQVRLFVKNLKPPLKLSLPALETLAVVAYKQPITAPEIMEIRGVQGGGVLKTLLDRKLIAAAGRKNVIGKPILYKTTKEFLVQFGLSSLKELPTLKEFEELRRMAFTEEDAIAATEAAVQAAVEAEQRVVALEAEQRAEGAEPITDDEARAEILGEPSPQPQPEPEPAEEPTEATPAIAEEKGETETTGEEPSPEAPSDQETGKT